MSKVTSILQMRMHCVMAVYQNQIVVLHCMQLILLPGWISGDRTKTMIYQPEDSEHI